MVYKHNMFINGHTSHTVSFSMWVSDCRYITELLGGDKYVSCSVVLPALCHLKHEMRISDEDPAYIVRFKAAFTKDLDQRREKLNLEWLKVWRLTRTLALTGPNCLTIIDC